MRSVEEWEADAGQDAALDAAYEEGPTWPSAAAVILTNQAFQDRVRKLARPNPARVRSAEGSAMPSVTIGLARRVQRRVMGSDA